MPSFNFLSPHVPSLIYTQQPLLLFLPPSQLTNFFPSNSSSCRFLYSLPANKSLMGFPSVGYSIELPEPLKHFLDVLEHIHLTVRLVFFYMVLYDPTDLEPSIDDQREYGLGPAPPRLQSPPVTTYAIKKSLPTVEFKRSARHRGEDDNEEEAAAVCIICLGCVEGHHQIRELSNCSHVFHSGCLDQWVDQGQMTCPMCRSNLLPEGYGRKGGKNSWVVDRILHLFS